MNPMLKLLYRYGLAAPLALGMTGLAHADETFPGVPWGANQLEILLKFPAVKKERFVGCEDPASFYAKWEIHCQGLVLHGYRLGDVRFNVAFWLTAQARGLKRVSLIHNQTEKDKARALANCHLTSKLLSERHGQAISESRWSNAVADHAQAEWVIEDSATAVSLSCVASDTRATIHVTYQPVEQETGS